MSSGVEADIALDAAVIATLGLNRLLGGAAGLAGAGAEALAALAEGRAADHAAALAEAEPYGQAVHAVIERNARIAALAESAHRAADGAPVPLPDPWDVGTLAGRSEAELLRWCDETDRVLAEAERAVSAGIAAGVAARVFAVPSAGLHADLGAAADRPATERGPQPSGDDRRSGSAERIEALARVLSRLPPDTSEADLHHVSEAAEHLASAPTAAEAESLLNEVRLRVQAATRHAADRRAELSRLAAEREAAEQAEAERRYVLDTVTAAFAELGYEVDTGFETFSARDGAIVLTRGDRPEHAVKMRLDDAAASAATLRAAMIRTRPPISEEDRRVDVEREREWCEAFEAARARLAEAGVRSHVTWRMEPGDQVLPIGPEARQTRARSGERRRQRERAREAE